MVHPVIRAKVRRLALAALSLIALTGVSQAAQSARADHVTADISLEAPVTPGTTVWAAVRLTMELGWHTYWRNPGDTGLATAITWSLPKGVAAGAPLWPAPERFATGPVVNFGYRGQATLLVPLALAKGVPASLGGARATVSFLECAEMCIPEQVTLDIDLRKASGAADFGGARKAIPAPYQGSASVSVSARTLELTMTVAHPASTRGAVFYPATTGIVDYDSPSAITVRGDTLIWRASLAPGSLAFKTLEGVLDIKGVGSFALSAPRAAAVVSLPAAVSEFGLLEAVAMAFLGGLILNLMPCVLPILSMKALSLSQSGGSSPVMRRDGIAYFVGVVLSFLAIAGVLLALKAGGAALGWGFQLQSPLVVFALALLMVAIGLNLLGVFEIPLSLAGVGDHLTRGEGGKGAFFTGVLAVLVASPCTAPFMGTAVGYALMQSGLYPLVVFLGLGVGFALPFTALAFAPAVVRLIPKPGHWMIRFREFLAFPMFATAIWLTWVLSEEVGSTGLATALATGLGVVFLLWLLPHLAMWPRRLTGAAGLVAIVLLATQIQTEAPNDVWAPWSADAVMRARSAGRPVFVDFSAAWCVTCLVNERVALADPGVLARFQADGVVLLKGDWTNRNAEIASELDRRGRSGVPLYLLYASGSHGEAAVLPQILTPDLVLAALGRVEQGHERRLSSSP